MLDLTMYVLCKVIVIKIVMFDNVKEKKWKDENNIPHVTDDTSLI